MAHRHASRSPSQRRLVSVPERVHQTTMLTADELARRWEVNVKTIYEAITMGQIPVVRLARKVVRIALAVVERIEQEGRVEPEGVNNAGSS